MGFRKNEKRKTKNEKRKLRSKNENLAEIQERMYVDKYCTVCHISMEVLKKLKNFMLIKKYFNLNVLLTISMMRSLWNVPGCPLT